jgi:hypothetical protein
MKVAHGDGSRVRVTEWRLLTFGCSAELTRERECYGSHHALRDDLLRNTSICSAAKAVLLRGGFVCFWSVLAMGCVWLFG